MKYESQVILFILTWKQTTVLICTFYITTLGSKSLFQHFSIFALVQNYKKCICPSIILTLSYLCHVVMRQKMNLVDKHARTQNATPMLALRYETYMWIGSLHTFQTTYNTDLWWVYTAIMCALFSSRQASLPMCQVTKCLYGGLIIVAWGIKVNWVCHHFTPKKTPAHPSPQPTAAMSWAQRRSWGSGFWAKLNSAASWAQQRISDLR